MKILNKNAVMIAVSIFCLHSVASASPPPREKVAAEALSFTKEQCNQLMEKGKGNESLFHLSQFEEAEGKVATTENIRATSLEACITEALQSTLAYFSNKSAAKDRADYHKFMFGLNKSSTLSKIRKSLNQINKALAYDVADASNENWKKNMLSSLGKDASATATEPTQ